MTVIAWDGTTLAADRLGNDGGLPTTICKIRRIGANLVGISGTASYAVCVFDWLAAGAQPEKLPACQIDKDDWCAVLEIRPDLTIWRYAMGAVPFQVLDKRNAIGSGRDFAMVGMHLGYTAEQSVLLAIELDINCGNGVDTLTFEQEAPCTIS